LKQDRFGLVILMVGQQEEITWMDMLGKGPVPGISGSFLGAFSGHWKGIYMFDNQRDAKRKGSAFTMGAPRIGIGMESVMNVNGVEGEVGITVANGCTEVQKNHGIPPSTQSDPATSG
jgi:hypothetical protein